MAETRNNPRKRYLINFACILTERDPKTAATNNGVSSRGGVPIPLVSGSAMVTEGQLKVYNYWGGEGGYQ